MKAEVAISGQVLGVHCVHDCITGRSGELEDEVTNREGGDG